MAVTWKKLAIEDEVLTLAQFADIARQGFRNWTETSIGFDPATYTFTLTDTGAGWTYWRLGLRYTISGNKTVVLPGTPPASGHWFIYIDATDGALSASQTPWTLTDGKTPVASVWWNDALTPKYWLANERHTALLDSRMHYYIHTVSGVAMLTAPTLSGYSVAPSSPANANNTIGISACAILDQDIKSDIAALVDPDGATNAYVLVYRAGAVDAWAWEYGFMPYRYTAAGYIQYDNAGTMTEGQAAKFYNSYLIVTNMTGDARFAIVSGRGEFANLAAAQAEVISAFTWSGFEIDESVIVYRLTWSTNASYGTNGKCRLAAEPQAINLTTVTNASSGAGTDHNTLENLQGGTALEYYHLTSAQHTVINAPTAPASGLLTVQGIGNGETAWSGKAIFDTTAASAVSLATATAGTQLVAARRDHTHQVTASAAGAADAHIVATDASGYTQVVQMTAPNIYGSTASGGHLYLGSTNHATKGQIFSDSAVRIKSITGDTSVALVLDNTMELGSYTTGGITFAVFQGYDRVNAVSRPLLLEALNVKVSGYAVRGTTEGTNHIDIFDGTAPAGTLANGISIYSASGVPYVMNAAGASRNLMGSAAGAADAHILATDSAGGTSVVSMGINCAPVAGIVLTMGNAGWDQYVRFDAKNPLMQFREANATDSNYVFQVVNGDMRFTTADDSWAYFERLRFTKVGNVKIAGTAVRGTTEGTNHIDIFDGTAPVGTLANGISLYSTSGSAALMDALGNVHTFGASMTTPSYIQFSEMTAPSGGAANTARLFCRDNGSGKSQLCVIFNSGAIQVIATEP
jgi:hypothetical protein